jgi:hypothetical protein
LAGGITTRLSVSPLGTAYFALIGLGFMFVEIGIIQRVSVFLGHPVYGLAIGLFSMIFSTGIGSLISERVRLDAPGKVLVWAALLVFFVLMLAGCETIYGFIAQRSRLSALQEASKALRIA